MEVWEASVRLDEVTPWDFKKSSTAGVCAQRLSRLGCRRAVLWRREGARVEGGHGQEARQPACSRHSLQRAILSRRTMQDHLLLPTEWSACAVRSPTGFKVLSS